MTKNKHPMIQKDSWDEAEQKYQELRSRTEVLAKSLESRKTALALEAWKDKQLFALWSIKYSINPGLGIGWLVDEVILKPRSATYCICTLHEVVSVMMQLTAHWGEWKQIPLQIGLPHDQE